MAKTPKEGDLIAGKYLIEKELGRGGMGAVFQARHVVLDKWVALKWLQPQLSRDDVARERFRREALAMGRLKHPNVVEVYDVEIESDDTYLVMEFLHGENLESFLAKHNPTQERVLSLLIQRMHSEVARSSRSSSGFTSPMSRK